MVDGLGGGWGISTAAVTHKRHQTYGNTNMTLNEKQRTWQQDGWGGLGGGLSISVVGGEYVIFKLKYGGSGTTMANNSGSIYFTFILLPASHCLSTVLTS